MGFRQRFPVFARPLQFLAGTTVFLFGLYQGLNWTWDWALQTGNIFIQIEIPSQLIVLTDEHGLFLALAAMGFAFTAIFGRSTRSTAERQVREGTQNLWSPRFRFYPLTLLLGLFLAYFGIVFLFHASVAADDTPTGFVAFVYLNYAGIMHRGIVSLLSLAILLTGASFATIFAFVPGLGIPASRFEPTGHAAPEPKPEPLEPLEVAPPAPKPIPGPRPVAKKAPAGAAGISKAPAQPPRPRAVSRGAAATGASTAPPRGP